MIGGAPPTTEKDRTRAPPPAMCPEEELLLMERIRALEAGQAELRREVSKFQLPTGRPLPRAQPQRAAALPITLRHHKLILQSLGQAVHIIDLQGKVMYWNRHAEQLYGYSATEAVGRDIARLIINPRDVGASDTIVGNVFRGRCWRGRFPVRNKPGDRFYVAVDATPLYDDDGTLVGLVCLATDARALEEIMAGPYISGSYT